MLSKNYSPEKSLVNSHIPQHVSQQKLVITDKEWERDWLSPEKKTQFFQKKKKCLHNLNMQ